MNIKLLSLASLLIVSTMYPNSESSKEAQEAATVYYAKEAALALALTQLFYLGIDSINGKPRNLKSSLAVAGIATGVGVALEKFGPKTDETKLDEGSFFRMFFWGHIFRIFKS